MHLLYVMARMGQAKEVEVVSESELVGAAKNPRPRKEPEP
jgi:hypothetical protein